MILFGHSQGHSKKHTGFLQASTVKLHFGVEQSTMHHSGDYEGLLGCVCTKIGSWQYSKMVFQSSDARTFYLSDEQKELCSNDQMAWW